MPFPYDKYPWLNFQELNLAYFIRHFREIFEQWDQLYHDLTEWKEATDEDLAEWKAAVELGLDSWKAGIEAQQASWEADTMAALNAWKTAFENLFNSTFTNLTQIKTDAEAARDAAQAAAASVSASAAQIATNASDISALQTKTSAVFTGQSSAYAEQIPANSDLDSYITIGNYIVTTEAIAATISHIPSSRSGRLYVFQTGVSAHLTQLYIADTTGEIYSRGYITSSATWSDWIGFDHAIKDSLGRIFAGYAADATAIPTSADLNTYKSTGNYKITSSSIAASCLNCPSGYPGRLYVFEGGVSAHIFQIYYADTEGEMFIRAYTTSSDAWSDWLGYTHADHAQIGSTAKIVMDSLSGANLINYSAITPNKRIRVSTGAISDNANNSISDFIPVTPGITLRINFNLKSDSFGTTYYDADKNFISGAGLPGIAANMTQTVPAGAYFVRYTIANTALVSGAETAKCNVISFNTPFAIVDKTKWLAVGDSITLGYYSYTESGTPHEAQTDACWTKLLADSLNYELTTMASRGMGYSTGVTGKDPLDPSGDRINLNTLLTRIEAMNDDFNLVTLAFGINDYGEPSHSDLTTLAAGVDDAVQRLSVKFPNARLVVITPFNSSRKGTSATNYAYGYEHVNKTLKQVADKIQERCAAYGAECLYATNGFLITNGNILTLLPDNTHPSLTAHRLIAKTIAHALLY